ncbi:MAG: cysteine--tRNA ligase [Opitutus sp.]|nr:cysteine--tRNA ligase [Opitutus sp.]MCS6248644.1 cysteine--tRNA ligase [Opitutus sp.]MCS6275193.1 cysteine--tRNA ligase [Opitutus sp.]MCS6279034.1 cysteine--tRNA ligase [Opitutus sp.]MCS6298631.1 cysteine--tRNA ligase [Opitutus sp.]
MAIQLHDSLTREARELLPSQADGVFRFYNCGPTVYAAAHIGNFRTFVVNDLLRRLLELEFGKTKVHHVRNLTDVDDKTIRRSREEGRPLAEVTRHWTDKFHADCAALNCLPPHDEPRAADPRFIREQVNMIEVLMEKGNAYRAADGSVYFKVASYPGYGALSRVKERELQVGATLKSAAADADEKEDVSDFALWKAHKPEDGDVKWPGPRGTAEGRPGWHIECSAMSKALLGPTIDLHTGGVDLLFPHHENEIAQSECCNGTTFARHWYHSEHLLVDGKKMSKSLGNLYTLDDLKAKGFTPAALRYALLAGHPRKQLNFTLDALPAAEKALSTLRAFRAQLTPAGTADPFGPVLASLQDDLNTPGALGALFTLINRGATDSSPAAFERVIFALGLDLAAPVVAKTEIPAEITALAEKRWAAKQAKDFTGADALRKELTAAGWSMLDRKDGYSLEPVKK